MTSYTIGDLVSVDERAAFRNDVQLGHFDDPQLNLGLVNSYLFSSALPSGSSLAQTTGVSPVGVLEALVQSFVSTLKADKNRFSVIATYGHGKSHLALALANYFSHAAQSAEVTTLLNKLGNALGDPAKMARYRDFKKSRGEFLVVRLRGDVANNLHDQFLLGLEKAMGEHEATRQAKLPFWFVEVERILGGWNTADQEKATRFLDTHSLDLPSLRQRLAAREDVYDLCVKLIHHVTNIRPNLGGGASLAQAVRWVTDQFCGTGKPLGGLLILFDEFSLYVQKYAQRNAAGELQDLLNGVSDREGTAAFLAFSQTDVMELADTLYLIGSTQQGLKRELTRINQKMTLFSIMESVIDAYLIQDEQKWASFLKGPQNRGPFSSATDTAWERFKPRYQTVLRWTPEQFQERVSKGCFPLHPVTTYLLCNLKLQSNDATSARTVLGFVLKELKAREEEPAAEGNRPNWVLPISLVEYFEGRLSGDVYAQYATAQRTIGDDAPPEQQALLQALLLQNLAELTIRRDEQIEFLATSAGLDEKVAKPALRTMSDKNIIRYDQTYRTYSFWAAVNQPAVLKEAVQKKLETFKWSIEEQDALNQKVQGTAFGSVEIPIDWGHATDWAAREYLVTADLLEEWLKRLQTQFGYNHRGLQPDPDRSTLIWVIATRDEEVCTLRDNIQQLFQATFARYGAHPPVVAAVIPQHASPRLLEAYRQQWALEKLPPSDRNNVGNDMYLSEVVKATSNLATALKDFLGADLKPRHAYIVPDPYFAPIRHKERLTIRELFGELYQAAFPYTPNDFFTQYRVISKGANKLRDATRIVGMELVRGGDTSNGLKTHARSNAVVKDLCDKFLVKTWELLKRDYRLREQPGSRRVNEAWQQIDQAFQPQTGEVKLREVLLPLLNPPYGYDYNTAYLLCAAWFGYHRLDIEVSINGQRKEQTEFIAYFDKGPWYFFNEIVTQSVALQRRTLLDKAEAKERIQKAGRFEYTIGQAQTEVVWLKETANDQRYDPDLQKSAQQAVQALEEAQKLAQQYDEQASKLKKEIVDARTAQDILDAQKKIGKLPTLSNVHATADTQEQLQQQIDQRLGAVVEAICTQYEEPTKLTEVELHREELKKAKKGIAKVGSPALSLRIEQSLGRLAQREQELERAQQEKNSRELLSAKIKSVNVHGRLSQLQEGVNALRKMNNLPPDLILERDAQLRRVEQEIESIQQKVKDTAVQLPTLTNRNALRSHRDALVKIQPRCEGTELAPVISQQLAQADTLLRFFDQLEREQTPQTKSLVENREQYLRLDQLAQEYIEHLSPVQNKLIEKLKAAIDNGVRVQQQKARDWLAERERQFQQGRELVRLDDQLVSPPAYWFFLSESGQQPLQVLRQQVRRKIDEDALMAIERQFRQIRDRQLRQECLAKLHQILEEEAL